MQEPPGTNPEKERINSRVQLLAGRKDCAGLIRLLSSRDPEIQEQAQNALTGLYPESYDALAAALRKNDRMLRMGVIGALAGTGDPRAVPLLARQLKDPGSEVRWQAAIALGGIPDPQTIPVLTEALSDPDKYVRYSSAVSLGKAGWKPGDSGTAAWYRASLQDWQGVCALGRAAVPAVAVLAQDKDHDIRINAVKTLGAIGDPAAAPSLMAALADREREVRWEAALAADRCGIPRDALPRALFSRPRNTKSPVIAGFLNFILPGLGYGYLGKWWGIMIFQIELTVTLWLWKNQGEDVTNVILWPAYVLLGVHAWYITRKIPEDPP
ncbi:MAG TPA: HEAT repeat domain-containing protein [Methanoregula sp.]|nr:HEAT repeat domain-containing protein [Methanoregula sp.]